MEWDYFGRKGRDGQKKKIGKANERKKSRKGGKDEEVRVKRVPRPHMGARSSRIITDCNGITSKNVVQYILTHCMSVI